MSDSRVVVSSRDSVVGQTTVQVSLNLHHWLYFSVVLCLISLLALFYLTQTSHISQQIEEMERLERELRLLEQQNNALLLEIAQYEQVARIKQQAQLLGFGQPEDIEYVEVVLQQVASPLDTEAQTPRSDLGVAAHSPVQPSLSVQQSWWHRLVRQFHDWISGGAAAHYERYTTSLQRESDRYAAQPSK